MKSEIEGGFIAQKTCDAEEILTLRAPLPSTFAQASGMTNWALRSFDPAKSAGPQDDIVLLRFDNVSIPDCEKSQLGYR